MRSHLSDDITERGLVAVADQLRSDTGRYEPRINPATGLSGAWDRVEQRFAEHMQAISVSRDESAVSCSNIPLKTEGAA